ncbi:hypothetical protein OXYTRIMIC_646 [Oxytricha trifallax]|uniref:Uncharacterized protein n=1 Tax=Oxytricha trifallax TaxID=1172189 RepID=A0A073HZX8_9SPIT|nr:hypothetical protein OXYTRIMIC_646 [Oxytricha trifallax]
MENSIPNNANFIIQNQSHNLRCNHFDDQTTCSSNQKNVSLDGDFQPFNKQSNHQCASTLTKETSKKKRVYEVFEILLLVWGLFFCITEILLYFAQKLVRYAKLSLAS